MSDLTVTQLQAVKYIKRGITPAMVEWVYQLRGRLTRFCEEHSIHPYKLKALAERWGIKDAVA